MQRVWPRQSPMAKQTRQCPGHGYWTNEKGNSTYVTLHGLRVDARFELESTPVLPISSRLCARFFNVAFIPRRDFPATPRRIN